MTIAAAVLLGVAFAVTGALPTVAAPRHAHGKKPLIIAPRPGQRLAAKPVWVRVRAARHADLHVDLNGQAIERHFTPPPRGKHGVRSLRVSPSHGLRYGKNVLRVRRRSGGRTTRGTVRFRIRKNRPLAAAGTDQDVEIGDQVLLDASDSLVPGGAPGGAPGAKRPHYRWRVVKSPRRHKKRNHHGKGSKRTFRATIDDANSTTPTFTADSPGAYTLQLQVTAPDGSVGSDRLQVRGDMPPVVRLDTNAQQGGNWGVQITRPDKSTPDFYPADPGRWLHIVVLNRSDLTPSSNAKNPNKSYDCPQATGVTPQNAGVVTPCINAVKADVANLNSNDLVIAVNHYNHSGAGGNQGPVGVQQALSGLGAQFWDWWDPTFQVAHGTYSAVLVPKEPTLNVEYPASDQGFAGSALIVDNLVLAADGKYQLVPGTGAGFNTQAPGSDDNTNVIQVAGQSFPATLVGSGFQVVVWNPLTQQGSSQWFQTNGFHDDAVQNLQGMIDFLGQASRTTPFGPRPLVFIASRGNPMLGLSSGTLSQKLQTLADRIEAVGGTRTRLFDTLDPETGGRSYTLVGGPGYPRGGASEDDGGAQNRTGGLNTVPLEGLMGRGARYYQYEIKQTAPALAVAAGGGDIARGIGQLMHTLGNPPVAWPENGNSGRTDAIKWISQHVLRTDNIRSQYWTIPYDLSTWSSEPNGVLQQIDKQPFPGTGGTFSDATHNFSDTDFAWAKDELKREIGWLISEHTYLNNLATPFSKSALTSWADLGGISDAINTDVKSTENKPETERVSAFWNVAVELGTETPIVGQAIAVSSAIYNLAADLSRIHGEPAGDPFSTSSANAASDLAQRLQAAQAYLTGQLANQIASDYGLLKTVGSCASVVAAVNADCPFNPSDWQYTQGDQNNAANGLQTGAGIAAYGALLPAKYTTYYLPDNFHTTANDSWAGQPFATCFYPFQNSPASSQMAFPEYRDLVIYGKGNLNEIWLLGHETGQGIITDRFQMEVPGPNVTDRLFGTLGSSTNGKPNLGANKEEFFQAYLRPPEPAGNFPERTTLTGWGPTRSLSCGVRVASGPPLDLPQSVTLKKASRDGIPVDFNVPGSTPATAVITLERLGGGAQSSRRYRHFFARTRMRNADPGRHTNVGLRLSKRAAKRVRRTHRHRFRVGSRITDANGSTHTTTRKIRVRY